MKLTLLRLREPAVLVVLMVLVLRALLAPASFAYFLSGGAEANALAVALFTVTYTATDPLTVVVLAALVATCALIEPATDHARALTTWSLVVAGLGVLLALAAAIGWITQVRADGASVSDVARVLLGLVVPVLAVLALVRLRRAQRTPVEPAREQLPTTEEPHAVEAVPEVVHEPTWQRDAASGAAWLKAGDAAAGAAATGWGTPGEPGGWTPEPRNARSDEQLSVERRDGEPQPSERDPRPRS